MKKDNNRNSNSKREGSPKSYKGGTKSTGKRDYSDKKDFKNGKPSGERKFDKKSEYSKDDRPRKSFGDSEKFGGKKEFTAKKEFRGDKAFGERNFGKKPDSYRSDDSPKSFGDKGKFGDKKEYTAKKEFRGDKPFGQRNFGKKSSFSKDGNSPKPYGDKGRFAGKSDFAGKKSFGKAPSDKFENAEEFIDFDTDFESSPKKGPRKPRLDEERAERRAESRAAAERIEKIASKRNSSEEFEGIRDLSEKKRVKKSIYDGEKENSANLEEKKISFKVDKPASGRKDLAEADYKSVYRGRGKDEKPIYEKILKSELSTDSQKKRPVKKFITETTEKRPSYNFDKLEKSHGKHEDTDVLRLNRFIANSGICSRREADVLIQHGEIQVNGELVTELGYKVSRSDKVLYRGKNINPEKPVYLLLNKPKDYITTTDDPMERKTVMDLISNSGPERVFPVGRLDRNTTGLLLFTNDGELAAKLSHPSNNIKKIYQVTLNRPLTTNDEKEINEGFTLEDGPVKVDDMQVLSKDRTILGLEIHLGRNRIVRRIFAHLGYEVEALDRVIFAGLDKKDLPRGKYRFLSEKEVIQLKYFL